ncbi:MAG: ABC transporter ATP-binding protein [Chloroflexi bacterium]|nr:ABC transporter ATP-binding protein [Chloroflexota bacterium]
MAITPTHEQGKLTNPEPMVEVRGLRKDFQLGDQWVHALKGVDLDIPAGQFIAIMGPSGSGKSTLLYMLGGLDRPSEGEIAVAGNALDLMNGEELATFRRETIGFIFQAFHLVPTLTALENVALPGVFAGSDREYRESRALKILTALGMEERIDHRPNQLSGGQQQRVAIARALFNNPPIIMADEPTGALDSKTGQTVMRMLRFLCRRQGKTIIVVTHDPTVASYADRMISLKDGDIIEDKPMRPARENKPLPAFSGWRLAEKALVEEDEEESEYVD